MIQVGTAFRLIVSPVASAVENMATDEALLKSFQTGDRPILRLYTWQPDSVTIGVSQQTETYRYLAADPAGLAKRVTGGGVLFHGHDVSYALILPSTHLDGMGVKASYEYLGRFLLDFYRNLGLQVGYVKDRSELPLSKSDYCQEGFEAYDIVSSGYKLGGNAQRRSKKVIFQHGSVPLKNATREKTGTSLEAFGVYLSYDDAKKLLSQSFIDCFGIAFSPSELSAEELRMKETIMRETHAS